MSIETKDIGFSCPIAGIDTPVIKLGHGSGGKMTANLIEKLFLPILGNDNLNRLEDAAQVDFGGQQLAMTIDSYVVSPIFFPGGDIGSLSVHGTVNDLSMKGAKPLYLSASFILEEGLPIDELKRVVESMQRACIESGIKLITADTKVVNKGAADRMFITTCGVGSLVFDPAPAADRARPGDIVVISGDVGRHGIAIMISRESLELESELTSDSCSLSGVVAEMTGIGKDLHCLRDITRGGLASVLNELSSASGVGISIKEEAVLLHPEVRAVCELLGLDPLHVACEGRFLAIVAPDRVCDVLEAMRKHECAKEAAVIGEVVAENPGRVILRSRIGGNRILDKLSGEQLPRIC